jgi:hypothetical protein
MISPVIFVFAAGGGLRLHRGDVGQVKKWTLGYSFFLKAFFYLAYSPIFAVYR